MTLLFSITGHAQALNARFLEYIDNYKEAAMEHCRTFGVPASITLAQGLLESNAGSSYLARQGNNHFGIKCHNWKGEAVTYNDTLAHDCYRKYESAIDSYADHSRFLCGKRYQPLHDLDTTDYTNWAHGLQQCGYAEDPAYPQKLIALIERYGLNRYDSIAMQPVPKTTPVADKKGRGKSDSRDVPAPPKKQRKQDPAPVPPRPSRQIFEQQPQAAERQTAAKTSSHRRTSLEVTAESAKIDNNNKQFIVENKEKTTINDNNKQPQRRQHNQRTPLAGKPLTGHSDNDD